MTKPRGPRAQAVVDEMLEGWSFVLDPSVPQPWAEREIEKTLAYQMAAFNDALADLGRAILDAFRWRRA